MKKLKFEVGNHYNNFLHKKKNVVSNTLEVYGPNLLFPAILFDIFL